jgi:hypothetical protein
VRMTVFLAHIHKTLATTMTPPSGVDSVEAVHCFPD